MKNHLLAQTLLLLLLSKGLLAFVLPLVQVHCAAPTNLPRGSRTTSPTRQWQSRDWIDEVEYIDDDEEEDNKDAIPVRPDMKYIPRNVMRQHQNFVAIRQAGGKELTNDVYIREPNTDVFWFVGKVARVSDVSLAQAVSRQWPVIEMHGSSLRPIELFPSRGELEIWTCLGDSEMQVAYNDPELVFTKMERQVPGAENIKSALVGFQGEMYEGGEQGFRTWRNNDGTPARPPVQSPNADDDDDDVSTTPSEADLEKIAEMLQGQDINELYEEQQRRAGKQVDD